MMLQRNEALSDSACADRLPSIALIGRPNVGKSSLFNRLTGTRKALVWDFPGVTRDYLVGLCSTTEGKYQVIDTLGWEGGDRSSIAAYEAYWKALVAAEYVAGLALVVDGQTGWFESERELIRWFRHWFHGPTCLVINKLENRMDPVHWRECHALGIHPMFPMSVTHAEGVLTFQEHLSSFSVQETSIHTQTPAMDAGSDPSEVRTIALIGRPNAGKSSLMNRLLGRNRSSVSPLPGTTRDVVTGEIRWKQQRLALLDTAGLRKRSKLHLPLEKEMAMKAIEALRSADMVGLLFDATEGITDQTLRLIQVLHRASRPFLLLGNKMDLLTPRERTRQRSDLWSRSPFLQRVPLLYVSAQSGEGIGLLLEHLIAMPIEVHTWTPAKTTQFLQEAVAAHPPPLVGQRPIRLKYARMLPTTPPTVVFYGNRVEQLPASYKKYLSNWYTKALDWRGLGVICQFKASENPYERKR